MKERQFDISAKRYWECPNCEHQKERHHATKQRPFCEPCEWQHAVLMEMRPKGVGAEQFKEGEKA